MRLAQVDTSASETPVAVVLLQQKHAQLSKEVRDAARCAFPDLSKIKGLKLDKLRLKDRLTALGYPTLKTR